MGYFDGLTDSLFKTDQQGKLLFYPWGILGKGHIIPNSDKKEEVRRFVKFYYAVSLSLIILTGITIGWIFSIVWLLPLLFWYWWRVSVLLKNIPVTTEKLKLGESYRSSARSHNLATLWILEVFSALFVIGGLYILLSSPRDWFIGLASVIFSGACGIAIGYMIKVKKKQQ